MKQIRRIGLISLCAAFFMGLAVQASGTTVFHVENRSGKAGDTIQVPVEFTSGEEVGGFQISVFYDPEVMEFVDLEKGSLVEEEGSGIFDYNPIAESAEVVIVYVVADTVKAQGVVADLSFRLKQDCGEQLPVGIGVDEVIDGSEENRPLSAQVTGVDETMQKKAEEQIQSGSAQAQTDQTQTETKEGTSETDNSGSSAAADQTADEKQEKEKDPADTEEEKTPVAAVGIVVILVLAAGAVLLLMNKKK